MEEFKKIFNEGIGEIGITLNDIQLEKFYMFYVELIETNKNLNLTAITDMKDVIYKHFIDSLSIIKLNDLNLENGKKILDIGTGAGFPGIPLAIINERSKFILNDSLNKRLKFIESLYEKLNISNVSTIHSRAEDLAFKQEYREQFDVVVSRAVANLATLSEYCIPFVKKGGVFVSYKSGNVDEELENAKNAVLKLGGNVEKIEKFKLEDDNLSRALVVIRKEKSTPKQYPRKAGIPTKMPL